MWAYKFELTRGRTVNQICYNKQIEDIIAVAYGEAQGVSGYSDGLILCWSVKNPEVNYHASFIYLCSSIRNAFTNQMLPYRPLTFPQPTQTY